MKSMYLRAALLVALGLLLAACSSGTSSPTTSSTPSSTTTSSSGPTTTAAGGQHLTVTPASGLTSHETVTLSATGFSPNESLGVTECANKGKKTEPGDCDLSALKSVTSNGSGDVHTSFAVTKGPFGSDHIVCSTPKACIVTVTQETPKPTQDATAVISFG